MGCGPKGPKYPNKYKGFFGASVLGIVVMVLGRYISTCTLGVGDILNSVVP